MKTLEIQKALEKLPTLKMSPKYKTTSKEECFTTLLTRKKSGFLPKLSKHDKKFRYGYSFNAIFRVLKHYYPDITIEDVIKLIVSNKHKLRAQYCYSTCQTVFRYDNFPAYVNNIDIKLYESEKIDQDCTYTGDKPMARICV